MGQPDSSVRRERIALIEDDDDSREVTAYFLSEAGFVVEEFASGEAALQSFAQSLPAGIVTDVTLPGMNGIELAHRLREDPRLAKMPIIALTGRSDVSPEHRALFYRVITKPFAPDELAALATEMVAHHAERVSLKAPPAPRACPASTTLAGLSLPPAIAEAMLDGLPALIWHGDLTGTRIRFNETWALYTGATGALEAGDAWADYVHPDDRERVLRICKATAAERGSFELRYRLRHLDGTYRWFFERAAPQRDQAGAIAGYIGVAMEMEGVHELDRDRGAFLSSTVHALRTPLTPIRAYLHQLKRYAERGQPAPLELVEKVAAQPERLVAIINRLSDAAQVESAVGARFRPNDVDIADLLTDSISVMRGKLASPAFVVSGVGASVTIYADGERLRTAIGHVLANAVTYSPPGTTVRVSLVTAAREVRIVVEDEGPGVQPDEIAKLGKRYFRTGASLKEGHSSAGLGLSIAKEVVTEHGGRLSIENGNPGLRVTIALPRGALQTTLDGWGLAYAPT